MSGGDETSSLAHETEAPWAAATSPRAATAPPALKPGDCLGRYTVRALLGAGGMGEVFAAHDPELDRVIALKIMQPGVGGESPEARARFLREAQAMARLSHPNVVSVFDVASVGERVFVAMELIEGPTLAAWIADGPHPWREVVRIFLQAGRGLEAAHAAGIVHRDFKPSNVILGERARVVDFGLARALHEPSPSSAPTMLDGVVTQTGEALGTPAYMAPEQRAGTPASPLSDQYSFAVALHEALFGARPGTPTPARAIPRAVRAVVERALRPRPEERYPSMRALLDDLGRDPARARRRWLAAALVVVLVPAGFLVRRALVAPPYGGAGARLAGVWDPGRSEAVRKAFAATGLSYSDDRWRRVSASLDDYAARWVGMADEACRATRVEGRQSDTLMDLRMACLERRRAVLGALTDLWAQGMDAETVAAAGDAAAGLAPLAPCADARALSERVSAPSDPAQAALVATARGHVDRVEALTLAHRWREARPAALAARVEADATGWPALRAEAAFAEGDVLQDLSDPRAERPLLEAAQLAGGAHDDRLTARALIELVKAIGVDNVDGARALLAADIAAGAVQRAGGDPTLRARLDLHRGDALQTMGRLDEARAAFSAARAEYSAALGPDDAETLWAEAEQARLADWRGDHAEAIVLGQATLARASAILGPEHPRVVTMMNNLGKAYLNSGQVATGAGYLRQALAMKERIGGADEGWHSSTLINLGRAELELGHLAAAEALLEPALVERERLYGPDHAQFAYPLSLLGDLRRKQGRYHEALELLQRALAIQTKVYGEGDTSVAYTLNRIGNLLAASGDDVAALSNFQRALKIRRQLNGPDHPDTLHIVNNVAGELVQLRRCAEARPLLLESSAGLEKALGPDHVYVGAALAELARCDLMDRQFARAAARLERAIVIEERGNPRLVDRGIYRALLARALWPLGRRDAAIAAAGQAEQELAGDADGARDRAAVQTWLRAHTARP
jgi:tetratricopeptide (TPR) repeat protein